MYVCVVGKDENRPTFLIRSRNCTNVIRLQCCHPYLHQFYISTTLPQHTSDSISSISGNQNLDSLVVVISCHQELTHLFLIVFLCFIVAESPLRLLLFIFLSFVFVSSSRCLGWADLNRKTVEIKQRNSHLDIC